MNLMPTALFHDVLHHRRAESEDMQLGEDELLRTARKHPSEHPFGFEGEGAVEIETGAG